MECHLCDQELGLHPFLGIPSAVFKLPTLLLKNLVLSCFLTFKWDWCAFSLEGVNHLFAPSAWGFPCEMSHCDLLPIPTPFCWALRGPFLSRSGPSVLGNFLNTFFQNFLHFFLFLEKLWALLTEPFNFGIFLLILFSCFTSWEIIQCHLPTLLPNFRVHLL